MHDRLSHLERGAKHVALRHPWEVERLYSLPVSLRNRPSLWVEPGSMSFHMMSVKFLNIVAFLLQIMYLTLKVLMQYNKVRMSSVWLFSALGKARLPPCNEEKVTAWFKRGALVWLLWWSQSLPEILSEACGGVAEAGHQNVLRKAPGKVSQAESNKRNCKELESSSRLARDAAVIFHRKRLQETLRRSIRKSNPQRLRRKEQASTAQGHEGAKSSRQSSFDTQRLRVSIWSAVQNWLGMGT